MAAAKKQESKRPCIDCGASISKHGPRSCEECRRKKQDQERVLAGTRMILTRDGPVPLYIEPESPSQRTTFSPAVPWLRKDSTCGDFLRKLIGALHAGLPYVRKSDAQRLTAMIYEFYRWESPRDWSPHIPSGFLKDLPLSYLGFYIRHWLNQQWSPPILAYAALEAAWFIEVQFWGRRFSKGSVGGWEIEACRPRDLPRDERRAERFEVLGDSRFKKEFTEAYGRLLVECEVPVGGRLTIRGYSYGSEDRILGEGTRFRFGIERCPLSTTVGGQLIYYTLKASSPGPFDLCSEFCGWGLLLPPHSAERIETIGEVPISWIVAAEEESDIEPFLREPKALPAWLRPMEAPVADVPALMSPDGVGASEARVEHNE